MMERDGEPLQRIVKMWKRTVSFLPLFQAPNLPRIPLELLLWEPRHSVLPLQHFVHLRTKVEILFCLNVFHPFNANNSCTRFPCWSCTSADRVILLGTDRVQNSTLPKVCSTLSSLSCRLYYLDVLMLLTRRTTQLTIFFFPLVPFPQSSQTTQRRKSLNPFWKFGRLSEQPIPREASIRNYFTALINAMEDSASDAVAWKKKKKKNAITPVRGTW